jgi:hypothetical protein
LIVTHRFEEIRELLDGVVQVAEGLTGGWVATGETKDQNPKNLANF